MNLYELTVKAEREFHSDWDIVDAWAEAVSPVLAAAGYCAISEDYAVTEIRFEDGDVYIETEYDGSPGYALRLPVEILQARDPVLAATLYRINKALNTATQKLEIAELHFLHYSQEVVALKAELSALTDQPES